MNNDLSSSHQHTPDIHSLSDGETTAAQAAPERNADSEQHKTRLLQDRKATCLDHLIRNIDIMIYCQLSVLYYME